MDQVRMRCGRRNCEVESSQGPPAWCGRSDFLIQRSASGNSSLHVLAACRYKAFAPLSQQQAEKTDGKVNKKCNEVFNDR